MVDFAKFANSRSFRERRRDCSGQELVAKIFEAELVDTEGSDF
jgi:hypothetical protein